MRVYAEMIKRGYVPTLNTVVRALRKRYSKEIVIQLTNLAYFILLEDKIIYKEHNSEYLKECVENLRAKGVEI